MQARVKAGRGVEFTYEAMVEMIAQRFPNLLDWDASMHVEIDDVPTTRIVGAYFFGNGDDVREADTSVGFPLRRFAEGAPVPTTMVQFSHLVLDNGLPRCGNFDGRYAPIPYQCSRPDGHPDGHLPRRT